MADQSFDRFAKGYDAGRAQIVFRRIVADLETPIGAYLKLAEGRQNTFLLESVQDGATKGRYSMIGFDPDIILKVESGKASINRNVQAGDDAFAPVSEPPLDVLRALVAESQADMPEGLPSTAAGIYGYLGYEMVRLMERLPDRHGPGLGTPRRPADAADRARGLRHAQGRALPHRTGLCARRRHCQAGLRRRAGQDRRSHRAARPHPALCHGAARPRHNRRHLQHLGRRVSTVWSTTPRSTSAPATSSRSCSASASRPSSRCRPPRSTARCAAPTPRPTCTCSISATSPSPARAPKSW